MKLTLLATAFFLTLSSGITQASSSSTYRGEIDLSYISNEEFADSGQVAFKWYFQPVTSSFQKMFKKTINHPLAESAFLEKSSSLSVRYNLQHFDDIETFDPNELDIDKSELEGINFNELDDLDISRTRAAVDYFIPKSIFFVGIRYNRVNLKTSDNNEEDIKANRWGLTAGIMIAENFLLSSNYKQDIDYKPNCNAKYVAELGGGTAVNFLANYTRLDKDDFDENNPSQVSEDSSSSKKKEKNFLSVSADYYFDRSFSVGTGLLYQEDTGYELRTQKFFSDSISAKIMYRSFEENHTYAIGLTARL